MAMFTTARHMMTMGWWVGKCVRMRCAWHVWHANLKMEKLKCESEIVF